MTDLDALQDWLDRYIAAWRSNDADTIGALFTDDATYRYNPFDDPLHGRDAIVRSWLENPDPPDSWAMRCEPLAMNGDLAVGQCLTVYAPTDQRPETAYSNIFVIRLTDDGRARDFTEWWMKRRDAAQSEQPPAA
ncbi:MAG: nuclear transport factor 2 family protein [Chloroflexota bacterium]|nr:nuclear transport factor 2 family protein [Chloroflexota bacterium]